MKIKSNLMTLFLTKTLLKIRKLQSQKQPFNSPTIENPTLKVLADVIIFLFQISKTVKFIIEQQPNFFNQKNITFINNNPPSSKHGFMEMERPMISS